MVAVNIFILFFIFGSIGMSGAVVNSNYFKILETITDNMNDHSMLLNGTAMCSVIRHRLHEHGIILDSVKSCLDSEIISEYGSKLSDIYSFFDRGESRHLKLAEDIEFEKHKVVELECPFELFFLHGIEAWALYNAPDIVLEPCYTNKILYRTGELDCFPVRNETRLTFGFEILPTTDCEQALEDLASQFLNVEEEQRLQRELPVSLSLELAMIWRYQMPNILASNAKIIKLRYP